MNEPVDACDPFHPPESYETPMTDPVADDDDSPKRISALAKTPRGIVNQLTSRSNELIYIANKIESFAECLRLIESGKGSFAFQEFDNGPTRYMQENNCVRDMWETHAACRQVFADAIRKKLTELESKSKEKLGIVA